MGKSKPPRTTSRETALAKTQADILQKRENLADEFFFPQLKADLQGNQVSMLSPRFASMFAGSVAPEVKSATDQGLRSLAMRGASGGIQATGLAALDVAKQAQQGQAQIAGETMARQVRQGTLSSILASVPAPTQAAPYVTESR